MKEAAKPYIESYSWRILTIASSWRSTERHSLLTAQIRFWTLYAADGPPDPQVGRPALFDRWHAAISDPRRKLADDGWAGLASRVSCAHLHWQGSIDLGPRLGRNNGRSCTK